MAQPTAPRIPPALRIAEKIPPFGPAIRAGRAIAEEGGPLRAIQTTLEEGGREAAGILGSGIGLVTAGIPYAAALGIRNAARAAGIPEERDPTLTRETQQAMQSAKTVAKEIPGSVLRQVLEEAENPVGSFIRRPVTTGLDFLTGASLPSVAAKVGSRVAAKAGQKAAAMGMAEAAETLRPDALVRKTAREMFPEAAARSAQRGGTRDIAASENKLSAVRSEAETKYWEDAFPGLTEQEAKQATAILEGRAELMPEIEARPKYLHDAGPQTTSRERIARAVERYKARIEQEQAARIERGELTPEIIERRARQPQRLAFGGEVAAELEAAPRRVINTKRLEAKIKRLEKDLRTATEKAAPRARLERERDALVAELKGASATERKYQSAVAKLKALRAQEGEASRFASSIEDIQRELDAITSEGISGTAAKVNALWRKVGRLEQRAKTSQKAGTRMLRLGGEQERVAEGAAALAGERQSPVSIMSKIGTARGRLGQANAAMRKSHRLAPKIAALEKQLDASRGVVPTERAMDWQTEYYKSLGLPEPTYVPAMTEKPSLRQLIGNLRGPHAAAPEPGYLKRATGKTFLEERGPRELDIRKIAARHSEASIRVDRNLGMQRRVVAKYGRPVKSPSEVDWNTESLIAPGMYERNVAKALRDGGKVLDHAMTQANPVQALDDGFRTNIAMNQAQAGQAIGPFYAVPKAVAKELHGQLGGHAHPILQWVFDKPNTFQRWMVLTARPGFYVNNIVGGAGLALTSGAKPSSFVKAADRDIIAQMPHELRGSGFAAVEAPGTGPGALRDVAKASSALNEQVDEYFRRASFISEVERRAASESVKRTGQLLERGLTFAEKMDRIGPEGIDAALKHVNRFMNDYTRQTPLQRSVLRRVFPFQSFTVHMARLASRLPLEHPMRARLIAQASEFANEYRDDRFAQGGHKDVPPYRNQQLPMLTGDKGEAWTVGTAGFSPTSGLGTGTTEFQRAPGLGSLTEAGAGQAGPFLKFLLEQHSGRQVGTGRVFTSPEVSEPYPGGAFFRANPRTGKAEPTAEPRPGVGDVARGLVPQINLLERLTNPNETYDLWGGFQGFGGPVERTDYKEGPRRYSGLEALMAYLGIPYRDFESEELEYPKSIKDRQKAAQKDLDERESAQKRKGGKR